MSMVVKYEVYRSNVIFNWLKWFCIEKLINSNINIEEMYNGEFVILVWKSVEVIL